MISAIEFLHSENTPSKTSAKDFLHSDINSPEEYQTNASDAYVNHLTGNISFGLNKPLIAVATALQQHLSGKGDFGKLFDKYMAQQNAIESQEMSQHPIASGAGVATGLIGSALPMGTVAKSAPTVLQAMRNNAVIGAGLSEAGAIANTPGNLKEKIASVPMAGATGAAIGGGSTAILSGIGKGASTMYDYFTTAPGQRALQKIAKAFGRDNITPEQGMQILQHAAPNSNLLDAGGENVSGLGRSITNTPGTGKNYITNQLVGRQVGAGARMENTIKTGFGSNQEFNAANESLLTQRSKNAAPLYEKAFSAAPVHSDRINQFLNDPIMKPALKRGLEIQRLESLAAGQKFNPNDYAITGFNDAGDPIISGVPNMRLLDAGKKGMDAIVSDNRDINTGKLNEFGRAVNLVRQSYLGELDKLNTNYAEARAAWAGPSAAKDALLLGRNFMNEDAEVTANDIANLSDSEKEFFRIGASRQLSDKALKNPNTTGRNILNDELLKRKLQSAFPDEDSYYDFMGNVRNQINQLGTKNNVLGNSTTTKQLNEIADNDEIGLGLPMGLNAGNLLDTFRGNPIGTIWQTAKNVGNKIANPSGSINSEMAQMLANPDQQKNFQTFFNMINMPKPINYLQTPAMTSGAQIGNLGQYMASDPSVQQ